MRILLIGGYGRTGIQVARCLLRETDVDVILGGRHRCKAEDARDRLDQEFGGGRVSTEPVDAGSKGSLIEAASGCDLAIVCARTGPFRPVTAEALLEAEVDCIEINAASYEGWESAGADKICKDKGHTVIAEAGIFPGLPSLLVNQASGRFDRLENVIIGHLMRLEKWEKVEIENFLGDLEFKSGLFGDGAWREVSWKEYRPIDFGPPFGVSASYPYVLPELLDLPERHGLKHLGLYSAELGHWTLGWLLFIYTIVGGGKKPLFRKFVADLMYRCHRRFVKPPYGMRVKFEAEGSIGEEKRKLETVIDHPDVYQFTAAAVTALVRQWLDGSIKRPGLWMMGQIAAPDRFLADMEKLGAKVTSKLDTF